MSAKTEKKNIVVVGGGTGTYTILRGLKKYHEHVSLTAVVTMADAGGSTGRLRDEFGYLPVGDVRMALAALAADVDDHDELMRQLFLYRFDRGTGLSGHNFGNLLLTALTDIAGSESRAVEIAAKLLRIRGTVLPVTTELTHLVAQYDDGIEIIGEDLIDEPVAERLSHRITSVRLEPPVAVNKKVAAAIADADMIIFGPGDLYTSIIPNCATAGFADAIQQSSAALWYVANLMTKAGQTTDMGLQEHVSALEESISRSIDVVVYNTASLPGDLVAEYAKEGELPVANNLTNTDTEVMQAELLATTPIQTQSGDVVRRSLIRHDSDLLAKRIMQSIS